MTFAPGAVPTVFGAAVMLLAGRLLNRRIGLLGRYNIPDPITGGLAFAVGTAGLATAAGVETVLDATLNPPLLLGFFAAVGLGGALLVDLHPLVGLVGGSITLVGGHGTGAAYAQRFVETYNIQALMELTMTSATLGLVLGGVAGGPLAQWLIRRHALRGAARAPGGTGPGPAERVPALAAPAFVAALAAVLGAVVAGSATADAMGDSVLTLPGFLWCLLAGVVVRNAGGPLGLVLDDRAVELIGSTALALFLALTMMALRLDRVVTQDAPLLAILVLQVAVVLVWGGAIVFTGMGRDYEAAVMSAAFCGFPMGATATAVANVQAITREHGPAPTAALVVPLVGAFVLDLLNAVVLALCLALPMLGG